MGDVLSTPSAVWQDGYLDMMHDNDRNNKYFAAIKSAVAERHKNDQKAIVLDIGTGCGLLAMMAARAGADEIYACEQIGFMFNCAKNVVARNNFSNIKLINKNSKNIIIGDHGDMPEKANIMVTELFGCSFLAEGAIETINHANEYLLTDDCIHIPQKAILYAQVVDCELINKMNYIQNISLPNGQEVKFPDSIKTCSDKTNLTVEMQLSTLTRDMFQRISNTLAIFEFNWNENVPEFDANYIEFISRTNGNANTVFLWWDLFMDSTEENVISVKPTWAGGSTDNWRYGWMPAIHTGHCSIELDLQEGTECILKVFHNSTDIQFKICKASAPLSRDVTIDSFSNPCSCLIHDLMSSYKIAEVNDAVNLEKYVEILQTNIIPNKTTVLVLSEPEGTILHLLAAALGAKKVFVLPPHSLFKEYATKNLISFNQFEDKIQLLPSSVEDLSSDDFENCKIDFVMGEPFFRKNSFSQSTDFVPFDDLVFWKHLSFIKDELDVLSLNCPISPNTAIIKAIAIKFDCPLSRINWPIDYVCDNQFCIQDFSNLMRLPGSQKVASMNYQFLWQYPGIVASEPIEILHFNASSEIPAEGQMENEGTLHLKMPADGFVVWIEWKTDDKTFSSGPIESPIVGQPVIWHNYKKQGIHYNYNVWQEMIDWKVVFNNRSHELTFEF